MAFTSKHLEELLADHPDRDALIEQIIELHTAEIAPLLADIERAKDALYWKERYEAVKSEFEAARAEGDRRAAYEKKVAVFRNLLTEMGINPYLIPALIRASGGLIEHMEVRDGVVSDRETICLAIRSEFAEYIS